MYKFLYVKNLYVTKQQQLSLSSLFANNSLNELIRSSDTQCKLVTCDQLTAGHVTALLKSDAS